MPRKFVFNEFKLTGVNGSVFRIVLGRKDNRLIPLVRNAEFKEHICVASGNVGDREGCLGNLLGDLLQQLFCEYIAVAAFHAYLVFCFKVPSQVKEEVVQLRPKRHDHETKRFAQRSGAPLHCQRPCRRGLYAVGQALEVCRIVNDILKPGKVAGQTAVGVEVGRQNRRFSERMRETDLIEHVRVLTADIRDNRIRLTNAAEDKW